MTIVKKSCYFIVENYPGVMFAIISLDYDFGHLSYIKLVNCIFTHPLHHHPLDTSSCRAASTDNQLDTIHSIFKLCTTGLNSEFTFYTDCLTKTKEPRLPYYLPIVGRDRWFHAFPEGISDMKRKQPYLGFELRFPFLFPTTITSNQINPS